MNESKKEKKVARDKKREKLQGQIEQLKQEKDELFAKFQRLSADYANYQKRSAKQIEDSILYEKERVIKTLLPAMDNFSHTLANVEMVENAEDIIKGVKIIYDQMLDILKSHNVEQINAVGQRFDPSMHEAMLQRQEPEQEDGVVLEEFQRGYRLNGRIIRPSKVIVNKLDSKSQRGRDEEQEEQ